MKAEQLRKSILQLAIQGKLVPQDPNDEPASVLLERIRAEKQRLIKEGKIKKDKNDSVIFKGDDNRHYEKVGSEIKDITDDLPFEIPDSWVWTRLSSIFHFINGDRGKNYPAKAKLKSTGEIPFISAVNMENGTVKSEGLLYLTNEQYNLLGGGHLNRNDFVFCLRGSLGKFCQYPFPFGAIASSLVILRKYFSINDGYIKIYLAAPLLLEQINDSNNGTAQPNLGARDVSQFLFPLPPLAEQARIVTEIEKFEPLIAEYDKLEQQATKLDEQIYDKLKKSILQYAIQGKLVPQNPNDEPASVLLERIRAEKKAKLGKKYVNSYIYKGDDNCYYEKVGTNEPVCLDNLPFDIPDSWCWARLGTIGDWGAGATPARTNSQYYGGNIPWLKTGELNNDTVYDSEEHITDDALKNCSLRYCQIGDILIAMYGATIGKLAIAGAPLTTNQAYCACTPYEGIYNLYLFYFLMEEKDNFTQMGFGGAQPNISKEKIVKHLFPVPPYEEQKRIVSTFIDIQNKLKDEA